MPLHADSSSSEAERNVGPLLFASGKKAFSPLASRRHDEGRRVADAARRSNRLSALCCFPAALPPCSDSPFPKVQSNAPLAGTAKRRLEQLCWSFEACHPPHTCADGFEVNLSPLLPRHMIPAGLRDERDPPERRTPKGTTAPVRPDRSGRHARELPRRWQRPARYVTHRKRLRHRPSLAHCDSCWPHRHRGSSCRHRGRWRRRRRHRDLIRIEPGKSGPCAGPARQA